MRTDHCPLDDVVARWTHLTDGERDDHARRLIGRAAPDRLTAHRDFAALIEAALDDDLVAFAWLAEQLRPALLAVGRDLQRIDPVEWAGVAIEALHRELQDVARVDPRWQRRRLHQRVMMRVRRASARACRDRALTVTFDQRQVPDRVLSPLDDVVLRLELDRVLAEVDPAAAEGLVAVAAGRGLDEVAACHGLRVPALRKRMSRARPHLQSRLADWVAT